MDFDKQELNMNHLQFAEQPLSNINQQKCQKNENTMNITVAVNLH